MGERNFDIKKTVKVCGVWQLLHDQIEKEFQKKRNSTGYKDDVNDVLVCPDGEDYILVEFVNDITDPSSIGKTLKIAGTDLKVEKWESPTVSSEDLKARARSARQNQVNQRRYGLISDPKPMAEGLFSEAKVKLKDNVAKKIGQDPELKKILDEEKVKLHNGQLKGKWTDIFTTGKKLLSYIPGFDFIADFSEQESTFSSQSSIDELEVTPKDDQSGRNIEPDETFNVSSLFLRYIISYHYEEYQKLENVCKEISFEVSKSSTDRNLKIFARKDVGKDEFSKTVDNFIDFYQNQNQKMLQEIISKKNSDIIFEARTRFSVVIGSAQDKNKMVIYGEIDKVQQALKFLKSKVSDSTTSAARSPSDPEDATGRSFSGGKTDGSSPNPKSEPGGKVIINKLSCVLFQDVKVAVYQGDVTKDTADVIVNPANEHLKHCAGAAEAIVKAGGKSIQDESDEIMKKRHHGLNPGEVVVTKAGYLPCKMIIHVVGPRWANYRHYEKDTAKKVLRNSVLNCLTNASHNAAKSISIPAISSGIFGVPVQICAEVLFSAATDFAKNAPKSNSLKEIRFVNIDDATSQIFVREMKKRFGASILQENVEWFHNNIVRENEMVDRYSQHQFDAWMKNPMPATQAPSTVEKKMSKVTSGGGRDAFSGTHGNKYDLNPKAPAFSSGSSNSSSTPTSYSGAVTGISRNPKDGNLVASPSTFGDDKCAICLCDFTDKETLKCGHSFCANCIHEAFKHQKKCPVCSTVYGPLIGNQPDGKMFVSHSSLKLPGYESCRGSILVTYKFEPGVQGKDHPNCGHRYSGTTRYGYLPDNREGQKVARLLKKAFDQKLTFTIGRSSTSGANNVITWNDIHHKTNIYGGPTKFGYPDPNYLKRVQEELAAKGITE